MYRIVEKERQRGCPSFRYGPFGIILHIAAAALGWFAHPLLAVAIFMLIVGYYAWTSQGIHPGR